MRYALECTENKILKMCLSYRKVGKCNVIYQNDFFVLIGTDKGIVLAYNL